MQNKTRSIILFFVLAFSFSGGVKAQANSALPSNTETLPALYTAEDKVYALSVLWSELKFDFVGIDRICFDLDSLYKAHIPLVLQSQNDVEYFNTLKRFVAKFSDGHTAILNYSYNWNDVFDYAPIMVEELDGHYYLSQLYESSGLDSLSLGAEIIQIEGIPTRQYVEENYFPYIAAGSSRVKYFVAANEIGTGFPGSFFTGKLKRRDGREMPFRLSNNYLQCRKEGKNGKSWRWKGIRKPRQSPVSLEWMNDNVGWLDFRSFDNSSIPEIDSLMTEIAGRATGLIIDLRYCSGGSSLVGDHLMPYVVDADYYLTGAWRTRIGNAYGRSQGNYRSEYEDFYRDRAYEIHLSDTIRLDKSKMLKCPIVILTSKITASAAETFLIRLYEIPGRPQIIGQQTEGSTGAPYVIYLPHGACARICTLDRFFPESGQLFDCEGILPDIKIAPRVEDYHIGYDRMMEKALNEIGGS